MIIIYSLLHMDVIFILIRRGFSEENKRRFASTCCEFRVNNSRQIIELLENVNADMVVEIKSLLLL